MVVAGGLVALQAPINATLGSAVGSLPAASISFAVGLTALVAITLLVGGGFGDVGEVGGVPWWYADRRPARRRLRDLRPDRRQDARRRRRHRGDDRRPARRVGR